MAGDWIKMRVDLLTSPKVVRISSALKADRLKTVGALYSVWCLFDAHSIDGTMQGYTGDVIDDLVGVTGLAAAMIQVGWLTENDHVVEIPRFDAHNGASAKRRAQDSDRKREGRKTGQTSASDEDKKRTREEKRREDKKNSNNDIESKFSIFWEAYPNGTPKQPALKAFAKLNPSDQLFEKILAGLSDAKRSQQWLNENGKFVPHASTFLNQRRWEDFIDHNGKTIPSDQSVPAEVKISEGEINRRKMLCSIALRDYEEAKASGDEVMIGFLKADYEKAYAALREVCQEA